MDTVEYFVDDDGWPWDHPNRYKGQTVPVSIPVEIQETIDTSKIALPYSDYASGIVADWMEENRELLYQLNPTNRFAVERMIGCFRRMWELVGK